MALHMDDMTVGRHLIATFNDEDCRGYVDSQYTSWLDDLCFDDHVPEDIEEISFDSNVMTLVDLLLNDDDEEKSIENSSLPSDDVVASNPDCVPVPAYVDFSPLPLPVSLMERPDVCEDFSSILPIPWCSKNTSCAASLRPGASLPHVSKMNEVIPVSCLETMASRIPRLNVKNISVETPRVILVDKSLSAEAKEKHFKWSAGRVARKRKAAFKTRSVGRRKPEYQGRSDVAKYRKRVGGRFLKGPIQR